MRKLDLVALYKVGFAAEKKMLKEAVRFLDLAAERDDPSAKTLLGELHETGEGVERDLTKAVHLYRAAAEAGTQVRWYILEIVIAMGLV